MRLRDYEYCAMQIAFRYQQCNKGESKFARNMLNMIKEMAIEQSEIIERCIWEHSQCRQIMKDAVKERYFGRNNYNNRLANQLYHSYSMEQEDYYQYLMETKKEYYLSFIMPDYVYNILNNEIQHTDVSIEADYCQQQQIAKPAIVDLTTKDQIVNQQADKQTVMGNIDYVQNAKALCLDSNLLPNQCVQVKYRSIIYRLSKCIESVFIANLKDQVNRSTTSNLYYVSPVIRGQQ